MTTSTASATQEIPRLRILCLHGYRQNDAKLRVKISALRKSLKSIAEFVFVSAPIELPYKPTTESHKNQIENGDQEETPKQFCWWTFTSKERTPCQSELEESISFLDDFCKVNGPFDGILGFSQGATLSTLLVSRQVRFPESSNYKFAFCIVISGRDIDLGLTDTLEIPSLHIIGTSDEIVPAESSCLLANKFKSPTIAKHSGGHYIPTDKELRPIYKQFLIENKEATNGSV